jgi:sterol desaturase/sphingolipid hydroxylase (fatty acid hydroxylase superfamily)
VIVEFIQDTRTVFMQVKEQLLEMGLPEVWRVIFYVFDYQGALLCLLPCIALQLMIPAQPISRDSWRQLAFDWFYPIIVITLTARLTAVGIEGIHYAYAWILPAPKERVLDDLPIAAQFVLIFLVQDMSRYWSHRLRHRVRWFWHFHTIHHSQTRLSPTTTHRTHPVEALTGALVVSLPMGIIGGDLTPWVYVGVTSVFWDFFLHSNIKTNLGLFGYVIASPQYHRVHHSISVEHRDCNFSDRLIVWDWMFGTLCFDRKTYPPTGVSNTDHLAVVPAGPWSMVKLWFVHVAYPFQMIFQDWKQSRVR